MDTLFDVADLTQKAGVSPEKLHELEAEIRRQYGSDEMLIELRTLRTLQAIADGALSVDDSIREFAAEFVMDRLNRLLEHARVTQTEADLVRDFVQRELSCDERLLLTLYYYLRMSFHEIAAILQLSEADVEHLHERIVDRLRNRLGSVAGRVFRVAS